MRRVGLDLGIRVLHRAAVYDDATPVGRPFRVERTWAGIDALEEAALAGAQAQVELVMEPTGLMWLPLAAELSFRGHRTYLPNHGRQRVREVVAGLRYALRRGPAALRGELLRVRGAGEAAAEL